MKRPSHGVNETDSLKYEWMKRPIWTMPLTVVVFLPYMLERHLQSFFWGMTVHLVLWNN
ncbi:hypothetical protein [Gracilibacillus alcaliphilus]|uniref:hypothetical protein n=1 Tax=Gracilibacillus alcaliphilus TaxID=1401441 RepID=UPI0019581601|nr:hypothetical protein [Gracilibacillus alcaliphilus]MBM7678849.1 hypothetical protein [Gracilibacillus alcaliphilus]